MKRLIFFLALVAFALTLTAQSQFFKRQETLYQNGEYKQAALEYENFARAAEKAKKAPPYDVVFVYCRLGECYLFLREYAKSEYYFAKAYGRGIKDTAFLIDYGDALLANEKTEKAMSMYQQCLAANPASAKALDRIRRVQFNIKSTTDTNGKLMPLTFEKKLNVKENSQYALAWYKGALLFSSDRAKVKGGAKLAPAHFFYTQALYDFQQDKVGDWMPLKELKEVKTSAPDYSFAFDINTSTYYVARCLSSSKEKHCNIYGYQADKNGKMSKPVQQTFHDQKADIGHPTLSSDGNVMFFTYKKDRQSNIYMTKKIGNYMWTTPQKVSPVINTDDGIECYPQLYRDSILFFASSGHLGMGGLDIFYAKITVNGVGHAVSGNSDLNTLEFSKPINLEAPVNSGADDFSLLMKRDGKGGFFISNRMVSEGRNKGDIYGFSQEPYVFKVPGRYLVERLYSGDVPVPVYTAYPAIVDTVYVDRIVGAEQTQVVLQQKDNEIHKLQQDLATMRDLLANLPNQPVLVQQQEMPQQPAQQLVEQPLQPQVSAPAQASGQNLNTYTTPAPVQKQQPAPVVSDGLIYRVQIAASMSSINFAEKFAALHQALPYLRLETVYDTDGYYRYVTIPYTTLAEAEVVRTRIKAFGYECFIGTYKGSQRVSIIVK